jgi:2-hydroxychromene-2-carboxylate isomerase
MPTFRLTWDYRCPFARIAHEQVLDALDAGAEWEVEFVPFSLGQAHIAEGDVPVWDRPEVDSGLLALQAGVVVRERFPEQFRAVHRAFFEARHAGGAKIRDRAVVAEILDGAGADSAAVLAEVDDGWPLETVRKEHEQAVAEADVWGVPTFIVGDRAVFVRLTERSNGDGERAKRTIGRILDLMTDFPELNEYKFTTLDR